MSYSQKLEDLIDHYLIANEDLTKQERLGWVGWLLNGNMCFGIYESLLIIRLSSEMGSSAIQKPGIELFKQSTQTRGAILSISPKIYENREILFRFLEFSMSYTSSLPPRQDDQWSNHLDL